MWETAVVGALVGVTWLFAHLAFTLKDEHAPLKLLLLLMSFLSIGTTLFVTSQIASLNDSGVASIVDVIWRGYMAIFIFVAFYFSIKFLIYAINLLRK